MLGERLSRGRRVDPVRGIGPLATRTSQQTFDGAALVGDACGYVDPVTGEGIFFAALTGPGLPGDERHRFLRAQVPCAPCYLRECPIDFRCMQEITVDQVLAAVSSLTPASRP